MNNTEEIHAPSHIKNKLGTKGTANAGNQENPKDIRDRADSRRQDIKNVISEFTRMTRRVTSRHVINEHDDYFQAAKRPINRLNGMGLLNKQPCIRAIPDLTAKQREDVAAAGD